MPLLADAQALQGVLVDLVALPIRDLVQLWRQYGDQAEFRAILEAALPQILAPYLQGAAMVTAQQYTEQLPESPFQAKPYGDIPVERIMGTIAWALNAPGSAPPLDRIAGAVKRMVFDASRQTALRNLEAEYGFEFSDGGTEELGTLWARYASATACGFCKVLATRGAVYTSKEAAEQVVGRGVDLTVADRRMIAAGQLTRPEARNRRSVYRNEKQAARQGAKVGDTRKSVGTLRGNQDRGDRYHDNCRCIAVAVRPGQVYDPPDYVQQWEKDYAEASRGTKGIGAIGRKMDAIAKDQNGGSGAQPGEEPTAKRFQKRDTERRQGHPGGPGGSPPPTVPPKGGKGYSDDDHERRLEWELDDAMRRRMKSADGSLDEVLARINALQQYRAANRITGRLDERFGKPFDAHERVVVDKLLAEGHNVTSIAVLRTGDTTPDMAVDGRVAEIKASISANIDNFGKRVADAYADQGAPAVFVNATRSGIARSDMEQVMQDIVSRGDSLYIRIIGSDYDSEFGRW
ncbi:VG15 protein [Mycolicibacterium phocaicum]|uniref:Uncharacterized protein n=1 Tax=Mycolicibacterium phocaicum TaxID=319706 RepID=A0A7I7ZUR3_9MYCO|nr:hypothetical protein [Mycolicibacterium phocaicum]TLH63710.1 hypothetical protein C1S79_21340 [Mycolicibacterium phocaicum]BBZ57958.1 hypothetical protein MPHO_49500 [Mycolicibacterium phocaicum]